MKKRVSVRSYVRNGFCLLTEKMNDYNVKKKLRILYLFCVLLPLILTDGVVLLVANRSNWKEQLHELENIAGAVRYSLTSTVEDAAAVAINIYTNRYINEFLNATYDSPLDYYNSYLRQTRESLLKSSGGSTNFIVTMYADNETIINGGEFARLETVADTPWYRYLRDSEETVVLYCYYDTQRTPVIDARRRLLLLRKLNFYRRDSREKVLKIELNFSGIVRDLAEMNYGAPVYVCTGDQILFSNAGHGDARKDFDIFREWQRIGFSESIQLYGMDLDLYILETDQGALRRIRKGLPLILLLICINALLPWILVKMINKSFTERLRELSRVFDSGDKEKPGGIASREIALEQIAHVRGKDEIGALMRGYNHMAARINELIQTVYKETLKKQEMDIARQSAELQALHSQINPHFLFNALESIRMHSVLKGERETASMVEKLAKMERQYVEWGEDLVTVREEAGFVADYLELQKYRYGDRLSYRIELAPECLEFRIPKLTLLTFTENACVHGMESKSACGWIFVRAYPEGKAVCLEIEDTGKGIPEPQLSKLLEKMKNASIRNLKGKGQVGIINACLRLKMMAGHVAEFGLESEEGSGTTVTIKIVGS
ncbi:MAG: histidine kinase [Clostridium sp.]|nr:histidine kinase [Clostridium sp.]